jgi:hypothetical protein
MKIGLSLSRCVRDIYEGRVALDEILVVIARTDFDPDDDQQWSSIWRGYHSYANIWSMPEWSQIPAEDEQAVRDICIGLKSTGRLHQPRQFGANPGRLPYYWLETMLLPEDHDNNPTVKHAWDQYQMLAGLATPETKVFDSNF